MRFTVATYNIHKGFTQLNRRMVIHELRDRLHGLAADIVFLQEVVGVHRGHAARHQDWPVKPQHEFIADTVWREVAYGKNAVSRHGHHGNAVLSRFSGNSFAVPIRKAVPLLAEGRKGLTPPPARPASAAPRPPARSGT